MKRSFMGSKGHWISEEASHMLIFTYPLMSGFQLIVLEKDFEEVNCLNQYTCVISQNGIDCYPKSCLEKFCLKNPIPFLLSNFGGPLRKVLCILCTYEKLSWPIAHWHEILITLLKVNWYAKDKTNQNTSVSLTQKHPQKVFRWSPCVKM